MFWFWFWFWFNFNFNFDRPVQFNLLELPLDAYTFLARALWEKRTFFLG